MRTSSLRASTPANSTAVCELRVLTLVHCVIANGTKATMAETSAASTASICIVDKSGRLFRQPRRYAVHLLQRVAVSDGIGSPQYQQDSLSAMAAGLLL